MELQQRKQAAAERAEKIRLTIQQAGVLYAEAVEERDWETLGYRSIKAWRTGEFGPDRFSPERRKEIVAVLTEHGWTTRQIAEATGDSQPTVTRDQAETRPPSGPVSPNQNPKQQAARDRETRARQRTVEGRNLWTDENVITWVAKRIKAGRNREQIVQESKDAAHRWPISGVHLPQNGYDRIRAIITDRTQRPQPPTGRPRDHEGRSNDQRARQLREQRRAREGHNNTLIDVLVRMNQMALIYEDIAMTDLDLDHQSLDDIAMLYDMLISMTTWHERALAVVQGWMTDGNIRARIAKLRDTTGRTPEEAAAFNRVADKLQRRLTMKIVS